MSNKKSYIILILSFLILFSITSISYASSPTVTVYLDGNKLAFDNVKPIIENNRTLVPLRVIFEALKAEVDWDNSTRTVTAAKDNNQIKLRIGDKTAYKNGKSILLDVPAKIISDRTMIPVRFVSEAFGASVAWNQYSYTVTITSRLTGVDTPETVKPIYRAATNDKVMALTFDDGYDAGKLEQILSILAENNIKCTFFLTGEAVKAHPSVVRSIVQQGHELGNHSYSHPEFTRVDSKTIRNEIITAENEIIKAAGVKPRPYFRPPFGSYNQTVLNVVRNLGYNWTILWTIDTRDWNGTSADNMLQNVFGNAEPGAIVLMHIHGTHTTKALPEMIKGLKARGYSLVKISDLISAPQDISHSVLGTV